jgi:hypothetical protein
MYVLGECLAIEGLRLFGSLELGRSISLIINGEEGCYMVD